ncbi:MAG: YqgE/AlgH family protein [Pseudomonadaceae bacterium]|nr:YqgE/AlgH family protein [Pseudomonadaceae bacterium]
MTSSETVFASPSRNSVLTSVKGQLLVATAELNGTPFERAVIYMVSHDENGAMGVMVNKPLPSIQFTDIVKSMNIEEMMQAGVGIGLKRQPIIMKGGPVDNNRGFVLHSGEYSIPGTIRVNDEVGLSATVEIVSDIARGTGPRNMNFCLGYAGWAPHQLDDELHGNGWLVVPGAKHIVFDLPHDKRYTAATRALGVNALNFMDMVGEA